jgi:uncharacterized membrane protein YbhN (UPF0104 family)
VNEAFARIVGCVMLGAVALYVLGSWLELPPLEVWGCKIIYPRLPIVLRQLVAAPLELIGASSILYFAMPAQGNPGYFVVLGVFLAAFSVALISHAPGGLGVLEFLFVQAMPQELKFQALIALFVFRLLYLLVPLSVGLVIVMIFERGQRAEMQRARATDATDKASTLAQAENSSNIVRLDEAARRVRKGSGAGAPS